MRPRIAIIFNEPSPGRYSLRGEERAVLDILDEVASVRQALEELGYPVFAVSLSPPFEQAREKLTNLEADLGFNLFEGFADCPETEAMVAGMLSELSVPYTGCPPDALATALDKARTKALLTAHGIDTPRYQLLSPENLAAFCLSYPCIVKPCGEDASHGLSEESVVDSFTSLAREVARVSESFGGKALIEEFAEGREFNATVLGNEELTVLSVSEIVYSLPPPMPRILTFAAKWQPDTIYFQHTKPVCPAEITETERKHIATIAVKAFRLIGCRGYARVDMRLDAAGKLMVLEVNPNPDISPDTGAARQAKAAGMTYNQFIERIVLLALETDRQ